MDVTEPSLARAAWEAERGIERGTERGPGRRRLRISLSELQERHLQALHLELARLARPEIAFYTPDQMRRFLRLDVGRSAGPLDTEWHWKPPRDLDEWRPADVARARPPAPWWEGGARGACAALVLLALLVLLVRAVDRCYDLHLTRPRRRRCVEWMGGRAPDTSHPPAASPPVPGEDDEPPPAEPTAADPPPPYAECTRAGAGAAKLDSPPPPYAACVYTAGAAPVAQLCAGSRDAAMLVV